MGSEPGLWPAPRPPHLCSEPPSRPPAPLLPRRKHGVEGALGDLCAHLSHGRGAALLHPIPPACSPRAEGVAPGWVAGHLPSWHSRHTPEGSRGWQLDSMAGDNMCREGRDCWAQRGKVTSLKLHSQQQIWDPHPVSCSSPCAGTPTRGHLTMEQPVQREARLCQPWGQEGRVCDGGAGLWEAGSRGLSLAPRPRWPSACSALGAQPGCGGV